MVSTPKRMRAKSIGHYILGKTIGEGTFGKVKLGTHILTGEKVAVKILEKERIVDVADVERVAREIHILKLIRHQHVIQLYEIIETPRQLYLIMEYCSGGELFDHIVASGRVRERDACRFFHQILAGVEQIHKMNVVHRDLKPENLLLDDHRNIKIVDFGLSNTFQDGQLLKTACGSPCYAAPEMIAGKRYVPNLCDVWSCGVILFALLCGYLPFEDQNTAALYKKILSADYQVPRFVSDVARDLIAAMLTTDPERRITIPRIRAHQWYRQIPEASLPIADLTAAQGLEEDVLEQLDRFGFPRDYATKCLQMNKHNHVTTTYYLLAEKKNRMASKLGDPSQMDAEFSRHAPPELELPAEHLADADYAMKLRSIDPSPATPQADGPDAPRVGAAGVPKLNFDAAMSMHDGDRAGGGSPACFVPQGAYGRNQASPASNGPPSPGHWAHPSGQQGSARGVVTPGSARDYGAAVSKDSSGHGVPPLAPPRSGAASSQSARSDPRRYSENQGQPTPRSGGSTSAQPTPRKRSPIQVGFATPRGPPVVATPPIGNTSRAGTYARAADILGNQASRASTPSKPGIPSASTPTGESLSARQSYGQRPNTSQGTATPARPSGSSTAREATSQVRRRHYTGSTDSSTPQSARGASRPPSVPDSGVTGRSPGQAWTVRGDRPGRTTSTSPDPQSQEGPHSARDAGSRDEAMRTCRGAFNVSCTSSKAPRQILQEIQRALTLHRVTFKPTSAFKVSCQKQSVRFEMEISHLDHLESVYVVRFRRVAGELLQYKDLCSKVLAEMKV